MLNAKEVLKLTGNKDINSLIIECCKMILDTAKCKETQCIIKPESLSQSNFISGYFRNEGFNVSLVQGTDLSNNNPSELYLLISWKNPKNINIENTIKKTTTVEEAVSKVEESVEESNKEVLA